MCSHQYTIRRTHVKKIMKNAYNLLHDHITTPLWSGAMLSKNLQKMKYYIYIRYTIRTLRTLVRFVRFFLRKTLLYI